MGRSYSHNEKGRSAFKVLIGKPTGTGPLGIPRVRWEDSIRLNFSTRNWVNLAQDRGYWRALVNSALNLQII